MDAPLDGKRLDLVRPIRAGGLLLVCVVWIAAACAHAPAPQVQTISVPVFIDNAVRCALPCAPFEVMVACQAPGRLYCKCANGETWDVDLPEPGKPQGYARPPALRLPSWYGRPRTMRAQYEDPLPPPDAKDPALRCQNDCHVQHCHEWVMCGAIPDEKLELRCKEQVNKNEERCRSRCGSA